MVNKMPDFLHNLFRFSRLNFKEKTFARCMGVGVGRVTLLRIRPQICIIRPTDIADRARGARDDMGQ